MHTQRRQHTEQIVTIFGCSLAHLHTHRRQCVAAQSSHRLTHSASHSRCGSAVAALPESPWSADVGAESLTMYIVLRTTEHLTYIVLFSRIIQLY